MDKNQLRSHKLQPSSRQKPGFRKIINWTPTFAGMTALFLFLTFACPARAGEVYDRVMESGKVRCGYFTWPPFLEKDVNTGEMSGIVVDVIEEIGRRLDLEVEWTEEVSFAAMFEGFRTGRYDVMCGPVSPTPARARVSDFTMTLGFGAEYLYARADDTRFDNNLAAINDPAVKFASFDGEYSAVIAQEEFPKAQNVSIPHLSEPSQLLLAVTTGKADVTATDPVIGLAFIRNNPDKLKVIEGGPVRFVPFAFGLPVGDYELKRLIDITIEDLHINGFIDRAYQQNPEYDATLFRVADPWKEKK